jgi:Carboxypeptidase regulatory-like domain
MRKTLTGVRTAILLLLLTWSARPLAAQSPTGSIAGTVVDASGAGLPGATVTATQSETGAVRTTTSTGAGQFRIPLLAVGNYSVSAELPSFAPAKIANVVVSIGSEATLRLPMELASVKAAVTVSSEAPLIEATRSEQDSVVSQKLIENLPTNGRNFIDFVLTTPGVVRDVRLGDISFAGQRGTLNSLVVDGADNNNTFFGQALGRTGSGRAPYQFSQDAVQEFQVNRNAYSAEYGRAGGAVINVVTKSGTNDFHGTGFYFYRDKSINAINYIDELNGRPKAPYHFDQFGASLGGPIVKDKLFFFANYDGQRNTIPNTVNPLPPLSALPGDSDTVAGYNKLLPLDQSWNRIQNQDVYLLKADYEANAANHVTLRYNRQNFTGGNFENGGPTNSIEHTGNSLVKTDTVAASLATSFTPATFNELRAQYAKDSEPGLANSPNPEGIVQQGGQTLLTIGRNSFSPRETTIKRYQAADTGTFLFGNHTLKAGIDYNKDDILNFFPGNFYGSYTFSSIANFNKGTPTRYVQAFPGPGTSGPFTNPDLREYAAFLSDEWRIMSNRQRRGSVRSSGRAPAVGSESGLTADRGRSAHQPDPRGQEQHRAADRVRLDSEGRRPNRRPGRLRDLLRPHSLDHLRHGDLEQRHQRSDDHIHGGSGSDISERLPEPPNRDRASEADDLRHGSQLSESEDHAGQRWRRASSRSGCLGRLELPVRSGLVSHPVDGSQPVRSRSRHDADSRRRLRKLHPLQRSATVHELRPHHRVSELFKLAVQRGDARGRQALHPQLDCEGRLHLQQGHGQQAGCDRRRARHGRLEIRPGSLQSEC